MHVISLLLSWGSVVLEIFFWFLEILYIMHAMLDCKYAFCLILWMKTLLHTDSSYSRKFSIFLSDFLIHSCSKQQFWCHSGTSDSVVSTFGITALCLMISSNSSTIFCCCFVIISQIIPALGMLETLINCMRQARQISVGFCLLMVDCVNCKLKLINTATDWSVHWLINAQYSAA